MIFRIITYISGLLTGFIIGTIAGQWIFNFIVEWLRTRGGLI